LNVVKDLLRIVVVFAGRMTSDLSCSSLSGIRDVETSRCWVVFVFLDYLCRPLSLTFVFLFPPYYFKNPKECLNHKFVFEAPLQVGRLVTRLSDKSQTYTQTSSKRPYGVGLLFAGFDKTGAHLYQTDPSGNFYEYVAQAIGARSQSSKTYLENYYQEFDNMSLDELIHHALVSLKGTDPDHKLTAQNTSILFVGRDKGVTTLSDDTIAEYVDKLSDEERGQDKDEKKMEED